jgi:hypothetical protein
MSPPSSDIAQPPATGYFVARLIFDPEDDNIHNDFCENIKPYIQKIGFNFTKF